MKNEYPENFARFYDLMYHSLRDGTDNEFFLNKIKQCPGKVLEIGVGTGRLFIEAMNRGADIHGIDISESMLDILKKKLDQNQWERVSLQNIMDFHFDFLFDMIIAPFRVIMHLNDIGEQLLALNNVYNHLNPGGSFIFDTFVPNLEQLIRGLNHQTDFEQEYEPGKKLRRIVTTKPELINQIINIDFRLEWDEKDGVRHEEWSLPLRYFFRYELEHLVERSNFIKYKILGDYTGNELNEQSKEFILICQK